MNRVDLHIHSLFSDGSNSPEEIVVSAINQGLRKIGFSDHSYTPFDESYCIKKEKIQEYKNTIIELKDKYKDKIDVLLGIEQDYYSSENIDDYDYVIGSVHYIKVDNNYIPVDESPEILTNAAKKYFDGDIYKLIECYYETVADVISKTGADIIGHIDLITKFNEQNCLFDEYEERYVAAYKKACDKLIKTDKVFEINTGAISRKYKTIPYPSKQIYNYLKNNNATFILSSDSHSKDTLCYKFEEFKHLV